MPIDQSNATLEFYKSNPKATKGSLSDTEILERHAKLPPMQQHNIEKTALRNAQMRAGNSEMSGSAHKPLLTTETQDFVHTYGNNGIPPLFSYVDKHRPPWLSPEEATEQEFRPKPTARAQKTIAESPQHNYVSLLDAAQTVADDVYAKTYDKDLGNLVAKYTLAMWRGEIDKDKYNEHMQNMSKDFYARQHERVNSDSIFDTDVPRSPIGAAQD